MKELNETDEQLSKLYEIFFESHPTPIYVWKYFEDEFILIKYNNAANTLTKGKMKDFLGIKASELYKDRPDIIEDLYRCNRNKTSFSKELKYHYQTLKGEKILNVNYYCIQPELVLVHIEDITDRKKIEKSLEKSEKLYRNVVEEQTELIVRWIPPDGILTFVNDSYCRYFKKAKEELLGKSFYPLIVEEDQNIVKKGFSSLTHENPSETHEQRVYLPDGNVAWQQWTNSAIYDDDGKLIEIQSVGRDITERKKAEEKLIKSEGNYRNLVNNINDILIEVDENRNLSYISPQVYDILGYQPEEIIGTNARELIHPDEDLIERDVLLNSLRSGEPLHNEHRVKHKDGHYVLLSMKGNVVKIDDHIKIIGIFRDITERKNTEEKLRENEQFLQNVFDAIRDGISVLDRELNIVRVNRWMEEMYKDSIPLVGKKCYEVYQQRSTICPWCPSVKALETGEIQSEIVSYPSVDYPTGWIDLSAFPLKDENGYVVNIIEYVKNITIQKKAEQLLKESEEKYRNAYNRSNLYKDLFTHDINNILQNVLSSIELISLRLDNQEMSQKFDEILNLIKEQITRGSKLVKNVQKLSEIEDTKKSLISIEVCEILKKSIDFLKNSFHYKNLDVKVISTRNKLLVKGNDLLPNIFENILLNAVKHNLNENIEILIKISKLKKDQTDCIKFEFIDNGIGIPDLLKKEIFSSKPREIEKEKITSGMGLGLILVKSILNTINGEIAVEDRIKGDYTMGSNFIILIPEAK